MKQKKQKQERWKFESESKRKDTCIGHRTTKVLQALSKLAHFRSKNFFRYMTKWGSLERAPFLTQQNFMGNSLGNSFKSSQHEWRQDSQQEDT